MARERCLKKTFQDSLEDIKERMKEKRTRKLAKVATVKKVLATKVKIINTSATVVKSFQANNQALAQALEAEKSKCRQAQDLILHLKMEHQRLMFEIFLLRRKLNMQQGNNQAESKLSSLKEIITKVTHNLLETANLLGPAHSLCSSDNNSANTPTAAVEKNATPTIETGDRLRDACGTAARRVVNNGLVSVKRNIHEDVVGTSEYKTPVNKELKPSCSKPKLEVENPDSNAKPDKHFKHVSFRRRPSTLKMCVEESSMIEPLDQSHRLNSESHAMEPEAIVPVEESNIDDIMDVCPDPSPSKEELTPFTKYQLSSSTPEPKPKQAPIKGTNESRAGREKARKNKTNGTSSGQLKKPWEKSKPRARSKSRERGASKPPIVKEKMNTSLNSGDAYDFGMEESIHVTPFRANKLGNEEEQAPHKDPEENLNKSSSSSEEDLNGSLYMPSKANTKNHNVEQSAVSHPLRPRSKRSKTVHQQLNEKPPNKTPAKQENTRGRKNTRSALKSQAENDIGNKFIANAEELKENVFVPNVVNSVGGKPSKEVLVDLKDNVTLPADRNIDDTKGTPLTQRIGLSDVTNFPANSGSTEAKKLSLPLPNEDDRKLSEGCGRKRRCTVMVNYAEPKLGKKLRRGDPFTDTEFLRSPIFKDRDVKRKSLNRKSLARYNEAFVGCR